MLKNVWKNIRKEIIWLNTRFNLSKFVTILICIICIIAVCILKQTKQVETPERANKQETEISQYLDSEAQLKNMDNSLYEEEAADK